jgi:hypothetical protein
MRLGICCRLDKPDPVVGDDYNTLIILTRLHRHVDRPTGAGKRMSITSANDQEEREYQKGELERSLKYCKDVLGLGLKV